MRRPPSLRTLAIAPQLRILAALGALSLGSTFVVSACRGTPDPMPGRRTATGSDGDNANVGGAPSRPNLDLGEDLGLGGAPAAVTCGEPPSSSGTFTKKALLGAAASCAAHFSCRFEVAASDLEAATKNYRGSGSADDLAIAQTAFHRAMDSWSTMEGFQFGPVADVSDDPYHGRGLRSFIHPWPNTNRCQVESQVVLRGYEAGFSTLTPNARGLFAAELLLFLRPTQTACAANQPAAKKWATLEQDALMAAERDYAAAVSGNIHDLSEQIVDVWAEDGEDFASKLLAHEGYGSEQEALNVVAWSVLAPETSVKDRKVGPFSTVPVTPDVAGPETPYALQGIENIRTNLRAFRSLFFGCSSDDDLGFDDWLIAAGAEDLEEEIRNAYVFVQTKADAFPPLDTASTEEFNQLYTDLKVLTDLLKGSFFGAGSPLNLDLPASAASDTD